MLCPLRLLVIFAALLAPAALFGAAPTTVDTPQVWLTPALTDRKVFPSATSAGTVVEASVPVPS